MPLRTIALLLLAGLACAAPAVAAEYDLVIDRTQVNFTGHPREAITVNGQIPGPTLRWHEGEPVTIRVENRLPVSSSLHWHGILLPYDMDGVPGVSFAGIPAGTEFTYHFTVKQSGTYWYHGHTGAQEQQGVYAPLVILPKKPDPFAYDRDYAVLLSDWTDEDPARVVAHLKADPDYYSLHRLTVGDFFRDVRRQGWARTVADRLAWGRMRMSPTDLADVTARTYTYLMNGVPPKPGWSARYTPGDRVRLRLINGSSMTYFDVRVPGLPMTVVAADGQLVTPVTVDELRLGVAETYDVIVRPEDGRAYTVFAETMDRGGYARGTLAPRDGMTAPVPAPRAPTRRTMADMPMAGMGGMGMGKAEPASDPGGMAMGGMKMGAMKAGPPPGSRPADPGIGLGHDGWRVLSYADLKALHPYGGPPPDRTIELHLTGNMERYIRSFDGKKFSEAEPIRLTEGERVRVVMINDTMMDHPIHLHGMWMELENGAGPDRPRKHTVTVKPGERVSVLVTADAPGQWAFHCHLLYHMEAGMFREVIVTPAKRAGT
jgi:FtsP/CotA-like multicopper oxidase with cupredoxin domain